MSQLEFGQKRLRGGSSRINFQQNKDLQNLRLESSQSPNLKKNKNNSSQMISKDKVETTLENSTIVSFN